MSDAIDDGLSNPGPGTDLAPYAGWPDEVTPPDPGTDVTAYAGWPDEVPVGVVEGDGTPAPGEDVVDAELVDDEMGREFEAAGMEDVTGQGKTSQTTDDAAYGQPRYPNAGGGSVRRGFGALRRRKQPRAAGASFGYGGGGGAKFHFSILGGLHLLSGNRADASVLRAGPIASPHVTGINSAGRRGSTPRRFW